MLSLKGIKEDRREKRKKISFNTNLIDRIVFILEKEGNPLNKKQYKFDCNNLVFKEKIDNIPPVILSKKDIYDKAEGILENSNPYFNFASNSEDLDYAEQLYNLDSDVNENFLNKFSFKSLVCYILANDNLNTRKVEKNNIKNKVNKVNEKSNESTLEVLCRDMGVKELGSDYELNDYLKRLETKVKTDYLKVKINHEYGLQIKGNTINEITDYIIENQGRYHEVSLSDLKKGDLVRVVHGKKEIEGNLECKCSSEIKVNNDCIKFDSIYKKKDYKRIFETCEEEEWNPKNSKKIKKELTKILDFSKTPQIKKFEDYIGLKVNLLPGGNPENKNYDCGGDTNEVPSGSEGIIDSIYGKSSNKLMIKFNDSNIGESKSKLNGSNGWVVKEREIQLKQGLNRDYLDEIGEKYSLSSKRVLESILKRDSNSIVNNYKEHILGDKTKRLDKINEEIKKLRNYVNKFK